MAPSLLRWPGFSSAQLDKEIIGQDRRNDLLIDGSGECDVHLRDELFLRIGD